MSVPVSVHDGTHSLPKLQIEAVLSVSPLKVTEPRRVRQVLMSENSQTFGGCYEIVLYYEKLNEDCDSVLAGWIVESLGRALVEHPLLAGRLHRKEQGDTDNMGLWEIVSNDSGVRLYEAQFPMMLSEFLALSEKEHLEAELVFWKEIDEHNPQFSPLFYVQVTHFECGGYSVGIGCSLLLADILILENFLKKWTEIHNSVLIQNEEIKTPLFYHPLLTQNHESLPTDLISRTPSKNEIHTMIFKFTAKDLNFNKELWRELAMQCVAEAEQKLCKKVGSNFSVLVKESSEVIKIVKSGYSTGMEMLQLNLNNEIIGATWNDFGDYDVTFYEGNKPVIVSRWIGSVADGHVSVIPCQEDNVSAVIIVSL
ncbi:acetyl-CoA-benzylalcohol acetyltransferase-like [Abrus precatorius]|uniref:Acetyl-CoA-benzylalcohol acetyltransferase-like n=1 Tax=Abrus precatorius TaxID=3816 RepID=A0A8B8K0Z1_ABRPR|nr:acetyl-CoA-benzylalcohol acetyltransferase-like [Abrus precatorius]